MLNLGPFPSRSHKFTLNDYRDGRKNSYSPIRQEPHFLVLNGTVTLSLRREEHGGQTEGGHSNPPQDTGLSDLEDRKQQACSDSIRWAREDPVTSRTGLKANRSYLIHRKSSNRNLFQVQ